jgi:hypothetical protein
MLYNIQLEQLNQVIHALKTHSAVGATHDTRAELAALCIDGLEYLRNPGMIGTKAFESCECFSQNLKDGFIDLLGNSGSLAACSASYSVFFWGHCLFVLFLEVALKRDSFITIQERFIAFYNSQSPNFPLEHQARYELARVKIAASINAEKAGEALNNVTSIGNRFVGELEGMVTTISGWEDSLTSWNDRVTALEARYDSTSVKANFVGLSEAFSRMISTKSTEKKWQIVMMAVVSLFLVSVPFASILLARFLGVNNLWSLEWIPYVVPFLVLELLLLYFFRIFVNNFYSVKGQLLQLQLRYHLCAFIQGYADFAEKSRNGNDDKLFEKFESLIFSAISADPSHVPSQFDGIEHLVKIFKDTKASG